MSYFGQLRDQYGFKAECTPIDQLRVAESYRLVGAAFSGSDTLDSNFWGSSMVAGASVLQSSGQVELRTNATGASAYCSLNSARTARYVAANSNYYRAIVRLGDTGTSQNVRRWGAFSGTDGMFFEMNGLTLGTVTRKDGVDTKQAVGNWTGSSWGMNSQVNTYEIYWTNTKATFVIGGVLRNVYTGTTTTYSSTMHLPVRAENFNSGASVDTSLFIRVASISRLGRADTEPTYKGISGAVTVALKNSPGFLHRLVVNQAGTLCSIYDYYNGVTNTIGVIDTNKTTGTIGTLEYNCPFFGNLSVTTTGAGTNITAIYE